MSDFEYLNECTTRDLAVMLVEEYGISLPQALERIYNSDTYQKLLDERTGLYFQSAVYIYSCLQKELTTGKMS